MRAMLSACPWRQGESPEILHGFDFGTGDPAAIRRDTWIEVITGTVADFLRRAAGSRDGEDLHVVALHAAVIQRLSIGRPVDASIGLRSIREDFFGAGAIFRNNPKHAFGRAHRIFNCNLLARRGPDS